MTTPNLILGTSDLISSTVNAKTGTKIGKYVFTPNNPNLPTGLRKAIELGQYTPLKKMGIDKVTITKVPGQNPIVRFFQRQGGVTQGATFQQGAPEIKSFIKMLKECASKGFKPDMSTVKALFKVIK